MPVFKWKKDMTECASAGRELGASKELVDTGIEKGSDEAG
jgi:hypothetical protein